MRIGKKDNRNVILALLLSFVPSILAAIIIAWFIDDEYSSLLTTSVFIFLAIHCFSIGLWMLSSIWSWILFFISGKEEISQRFFDFLASKDFPEPAEYEDSVLDYLASVYQNSDINTDMRIQAAIAFAEFDLLSQYGLIQIKLRTNIALENGLIAYKKSFTDKQGPSKT